jgi:transketolase C-terminal domain/subunit
VRDSFVGVLTEQAAEHPELLLLTGDLGFGVLNDFIASFPRQFLNMGVAAGSGRTHGLHLFNRQLPDASLP